MPFRNDFNSKLRFEFSEDRWKATYNGNKFQCYVIEVIDLGWIIDFPLPVLILFIKKMKIEIRIWKDIFVLLLNVTVCERTSIKWSEAFNIWMMNWRDKTMILSMEKGKIKLIETKIRREKKSCSYQVEDSGMWNIEHVDKNH